jgi:hypothetical protein
VWSLVQTKGMILFWLFSPSNKNWMMLLLLSELLLLIVEVCQLTK